MIWWGLNHLEVAMDWSSVTAITLSTLASMLMWHNAVHTANDTSKVQADDTRLGTMCATVVLSILASVWFMSLTVVMLWKM